MGGGTNSVHHDKRPDRSGAQQHLKTMESLLLLRRLGFGRTEEIKTAPFDHSCPFA